MASLDLNNAISRIKPNVARLNKKFIFKDKQRQINNGSSNERIKRMWLEREIDVAGLPSLIAK